MTDALERSQSASGKQMKGWDSPGNDQLPVLSLSSDEEDEDAKKEEDHTGRGKRVSPAHGAHQSCMPQSMGHKQHPRAVPESWQT